MRLAVRSEIWPLAAPFIISRGSRLETEVVVATLTEGTLTGRGECMANPRYGETQAAVVATLEALADDIEAGRLDRMGLQDALPAGAARNALDCAFWDLEAKRAGRRVWALAGLPAPEPVETAYTISLDTPAAMGAAARANAYRPLLKLKLAGAEDLDRVAAVRENAPNARLIVDANEGWDAGDLRPLLAELAKLHVQLIEQPLPDGADEALADRAAGVPVCADESCHTRDGLDRLAGLYDAVNIKLDKTGGLTEALLLREAALARGLRVMVGCMVCTSLAIAPAMLVAQGTMVADLDGPLLLARDRKPGLRFDGSVVHPPAADLWG
ncbi:MAG: dipeptide epimerase [Gammaproteobacteria bacterium]|jgi:L-alanine-DL-glutamate epimerase-like enolase superfamily enzyme